MSIRRATWGDLAAMEDVLTRAFWDEDACGRVLHPHRNDFPRDVVKYWRARTRLQYWTWSDILFVAVDKQKKVKAVAGWTMKGSVAKKARPAWWDPRGMSLSTTPCRCDGLRAHAPGHRQCNAIPCELVQQD